ncbi:peptidoglycan-associated lipoprotein Pal [Marinomonas mediterranea]|jgi:peptidoglycan-associated lipoprotein|uniref:Peptidoglycan-associated lipoprotein n=1 Tax=Marinomonas mediterranea (strain ATCC 700492 / JCM 21426 / NBRC 103028 / MMB-1) TaxID=717774 RepID=F2K2U1_MARM1|nr:peptidoglycan-associated lipoprotein Pal [Marinomonas mediterranea]ADZ91224.1 peptidoglycan-associated lipoprotein [Marinomonas mediterranea MMB-1]WCN09199.1 peptidoglycan-associated lipoprotein Pal [Marinomonas mediterranea]WCN13282.1 peptidoglycan-associated lipoprotein Pal [Marinomonas mediterranea]WCN17350.1 peptidoglycan-associated lipoprotein Pal [Marinomonas mediterranea MMB-1]
MSVNKLGKFAVIGLSAAWIAGCSTNATETDSSSTVAEDSASATEEQSADAAGQEAGSDQSFGAGEDGSITSVVVDDSGSASAVDQDVDLLAGVETVFYFDFDKSIVRPEAREALAKHAEFLVANPDARVVLEGHADERGTREYNMALGERRAKAVARYLTIQGVAASQIESVSFGEEVPVAFGHDDASWQLNRRVEVRYE